MSLKDKLDEIRRESEQLRIEESITTSYQFYQKLIPKLNSIVEELKEAKNEQNLVTIVNFMENLVAPYIIEKPKEKTTETEGISEKLEGTYQIYIELRSKGKTHAEAKDILEKDYNIKNIKGFRRWSSAYKKRKELLERKELPQQIEELPLEIVEKIKSGNFKADDYIWNVDNGEIQKDALRAKFFELGKGRTYRAIKSGVAKKYKIFERNLKTSGQNSMQYQNGGGRRLEFGFDSSGNFYSKRIEDAIKEHNLDKRE